MCNKIELRNFFLFYKIIDFMSHYFYAIFFKNITIGESKFGQVVINSPVTMVRLLSDHGHILMTCASAKLDDW